MSYWNPSILAFQRNKFYHDMNMARFVEYGSAYVKLNKIG